MKIAQTEEQRILAATQAALAAGKDPFGDDDDSDTSLADAAADDAGDDAADGVDADAGDGASNADANTDADADDAGADDAGATGAALSAAELEAIAADVPPPTLHRSYKASAPTEITEQRKELLATQAKALKDMMDGVIEADAYSAIVSEVMDKMEALTVQRTLHEANVQTAAQAESDALEAIMAEGSAQGIDYKQPDMAKQFDIAMAMLQDGSTKPFAALARQAHQHVLAMNGKAAASAAATAPAAQPARQNGKPPTTLRNLPAAAVPNTGGDWKDALAKLDGLDYEAAYNRLSPSQRAALLDD